MKIIELEQGSENWLKWRGDGIGASDIGIIMGSNPHKTIYELWEIKCGFREEDTLNEAMQHGIKNEPIARKCINTELNLNLIPICIQDEENPNFRGSLDGYDFEEKILCEIKCPLFSASLKEHWVDQVQWEMMLCNPKEAVLVLWDARCHQCGYIDIARDDDRIEEMKERANEFWKCVVSGIPPTKDNTLLKNLTKMD